MGSIPSDKNTTFQTESQCKTRISNFGPCEVLLRFRLVRAGDGRRTPVLCAPCGVGVASGICRRSELFTTKTGDPIEDDTFAFLRNGRGKVGLEVMAILWIAIPEFFFQGLFRFVSAHLLATEISNPASTIQVLSAPEPEEEERGEGGRAR